MEGVLLPKGGVDLELACLAVAKHQQNIPVYTANKSKERLAKKKHR